MPDLQVDTLRVLVQCCEFLPVLLRCCRFECGGSVVCTILGVSRAARRPERRRWLPLGVYRPTCHVQATIAVLRARTHPPTHPPTHTHTHIGLAKSTFWRIGSTYNNWAASLARCEDDAASTQTPVNRARGQSFEQRRHKAHTSTIRSGTNCNGKSGQITSDWHA